MTDKRGYLRYSFGSQNAAEEIDLLYMIIEQFKDHDPRSVYKRFRERGRLALPGLTYVSSWVDQRLDRCFQLMQTNDIALLEQWIAQWQDLADFEIVPVITSAEAAAQVAQLEA